MSERFALARDLLERHRRLRVQAVEERPRRQALDALGHRGADRPEKVEAVAVLVAEIDGRGRDAARAIEARHERRDHLVDLEDVREELAQLGHARLEVVALAEEELVDAALGLRLQRLEEHEEDDRRQHGVQVHRLEAADDHHEQVEDGGEAEGESRRDEQPPGELVDVGEARARDRLGEHEEEHDREHGADRRELHAEVREEVGERERGGRSADHDEETDPVAHGTGRVALALPRERDERGGQQAEHVGVDRPEDERTIVVRRDGHHQDRHADDRGKASKRSRARACLAGHDVLEEVDRELREQDREDARHALPQIGPEEPGERLARVPERDVCGECGKEPVHGATPAQEHAERDREREHRAEEDGFRAQIFHRRCRSLPNAAPARAPFLFPREPRRLLCRKTNKECA